MNWFLHVVCDNYANFRGRARRQEYWMFVLFNLLNLFAAAALSIQSHSMVVVLVYHLVLMVPSLAVGVRRLHDTDRSGWWMLLALIPLIGGIVLLVFMCLEGTRGPNRFGADPKQSLPPSLPPSLQK
jgi:uncharacterized membrane protein YhaH (DUF805 family)